MRFERWLYTIPLRLRSVFQGRRLELELDEELQFHVVQRMEREIAAGKTPEEAHYSALRAMEGIEQRKEDCRDTRKVRGIDDSVQDFRYAVRTLSKSPGFALLAVLVLALGIGVNTAIFTIVNSVLLQPLPFVEPDRLFSISCGPMNNPFIPVGPHMSDRDYLEFRSREKVFESIATFNSQPLTLTGAGEPVVVNALAVTPDFLRVLRAHPAIGRSFLGEGEPDQNAVLLSDGLWHDWFGGDATIAGKSIILDDTSYVVAGVMPRSFEFQSAQLWIRMEVQLNPHNSMMRTVIGRLKTGESRERAQAELETFAARKQDYSARVAPLKEFFISDVKKLLFIFLGAVTCVFLVACANFANLLLIRGAARQSEMAVRAALGAGRRRLVRQLLTESTLLSMFGGLGGVALSVLVTRALLMLLSPGRIPRAEHVQLDGWVLAFALGLSIATGIVFGLPPALQTTLRGTGNRSVTGRHETLRGFLVVAEIALAVILLMSGGLLVRSFVRLRSVNPGFRPTNILAETVDLPNSRYASVAQMRLLHERVLGELAQLPQAEAVATVNWVPMRAEMIRGDFQIEDGRRLPNGFLADKLVVSPGYFRTMGIRLMGGRDFTDHDDATAQGVVIASESVARRLWPAGDAIGKRISMEDNPKASDWLTIVGIVQDVRQESLTAVPSAALYQPYKQVNHPFFLGHINFLVRTQGKPEPLIGEVRKTVRKADAELPTQSVATMQAIVEETTNEARSETQLLGIFSIMALVLAAVGIYGVLAYSVTERTREIGIRMALGAGLGEVLGMVFRRTLLVAGVGALIGTIGALASGRLIAKFLFEVTPTDPTTFLTVIGILLIVALASAWLTGRRAARVDPVIALRYE